MSDGASPRAHPSGMRADACGPYFIATPIAMSQRCARRAYRRVCPTTMKRRFLAILLSLLPILSQAQGLTMPSINEAPSPNWKVKDSAFATTVFDRFDFDAEARRHFAGK